MWAAATDARRLAASASTDTDIFYSITKVADAAALDTVTASIAESTDSGALMTAFKATVAATPGLSVDAITASDIQAEQTESGMGLSATSGAAIALPALAAAAATV